MTEQPIDIKTIVSMTKVATFDFQNLRSLLDQICDRIAQRFNVYYPNGKLRKAAIIETIAKSSCLSCVIGSLSAKTKTNDIDALYRECHLLAVSILVEELYNFLNEMGYKVVLSTETKLEYGKADVSIIATKYGINLKSPITELLVEVKTGLSLSLSQLIRYLLDERTESIVVWRVRKRQILVLNAERIKPLLMEFARMICLRGIRLLSSPQLPTCKHIEQSNYQPTSKELEEMFQDFSQAVIQTLPDVLQAILERLGPNKARRNGREEEYGSQEAGG